MELSKLVEEKEIELDSLHSKIYQLDKQLKGINEKFPPRWSKDVKELTKYVKEIEDWIKNPKVKRTRELIDVLRKLVSDKRSFKGLEEDYLISVLEALENVAILLTETSRKSLRANTAQKILDRLQEEEDIIELIQEMKEYFKGIEDFETIETNNDFVKTVKDEELERLSTLVDFSLGQIEKEKATLIKASSAFELLVNSGIGANAYIQSYKASKSVDVIWQETNNIRELLNDTDYQVSGKIEDPFGRITEVISQRALSIKGNTLTDISLKLRLVKEQLDDWRKRISEVFNREYRRTKALAEFARISEGLDQLFEDFQVILGESSDANIIYGPYKKLQETKRKATRKLERQFSEDERRIIENLESVDELVESMGDTFWFSLKNLRAKQLIQIVIKRGE